ncbi:hypothetical protein [Streptomyces sp. bgisy031]|uniref:hypothetical protein n=1 Tax=Streptomyces sp. bgisy031 TaxID=3413772 RepID=UPI003D70A01C
MRGQHLAYGVVCRVLARGKDVPRLGMAHAPDGARITREGPKPPPLLHELRCLRRQLTHVPQRRHLLPLRVELRLVPFHEPPDRRSEERLPRAVVRGGGARGRVGRRVTLLGDTAHASTPNRSQRACQAPENAVVLAAALAREPIVEPAIAATTGSTGHAASTSPAPPGRRAGGADS